MKLFNTLTRSLDDFTPTDPQNVKIYTCGPTVYSNAHIGNFTAYIYWDLLIRTIRLNGWQENRILNITDVGHLTSDSDQGEDKLEKSARHESKTVWEIAAHYADDFLEQFRALNLIEPTKIAFATKYIPADIALIDTLTAKGYTYKISDGIYFDTSKFPTYADFAHLDLKNLKAGARVEFDPEKRNPSDFALWKFIKPGENHAMQWEYLDRPGYPGWHIECSAIIHETLGEPVDIHTGGIDHIPVHHTNEIAQSQAAYQKPLARFWLHNNFITIDGQKISKSLGNTYTFDDLKSHNFTHLDYRIWVLQGHFQTERNFSFSDLSAAHQRLANYRNFAALRHQKTATNTEEIRSQILTALNNNLNSALALSILDKNLDHAIPSADFIQFLDDVFGLQLLSTTPDISQDQKDIIATRDQAKSQKDYQTADAIRAQLEEQGITLLDTPDATIWQLA